MTTMLSVEQVLALAPDASAAKAGQGLARAQKWTTLAADERAVWGECAGSAGTLYRTQVDLHGPAFKCSCPSRKFPCKHSLGLLLLFATTLGAFQQTAPPPWVTEWLTNRAKREEKQVAAPERASDPAAQAKRAAQREQKVQRGLEELDRWLCDLVRQGLGSVPGQPRAFWQGMAARMVDAQASGVARLLRNMAEIATSGEGWEARLLEKLGQLHLLIDRYRRIETLPESAQADVRALIGFTQSQSALLEEPGVADQWVVLGQRVTREDKLRVQRTWLWGAESGRAALLLTYSHGKEAFETVMVPGQTYAAEVVFYPGNYPLRALLKTAAPPSPLRAVQGYDSVATAYKAYAAALPKYPWLEQFPMLLHGVTPCRQDEQWGVCDSAGQYFPLDPTFAHPWVLLAVSGGHPLSLFGEWDGDRLFPLSIIIADRYINLPASEE